jgi:hypothetical protein
MGPDKPVPYIDGILILAGKTFKEHLTILEKTLSLLGNAGFQVNEDKSEFFSKAFIFFGFVLNLERYQPMPKCVKAIWAILAPTNIKVVRHFLRVCNFIKNNIPGRAALMKPIIRLTKKDVKFAWEEEEETAFKLIKEKVAEAVMLMYQDPAKTFQVYPDASIKFAMGAVLVQDGKVILAFSRKFNNAQLKYTVTDQELLAILEACKPFEQIIHSCNITMHTNHKNLTFNTAQ